MKRLLLLVLLCFLLLFVGCHVKGTGGAVSEPISSPLEPEEYPASLPALELKPAQPLPKQDAQPSEEGEEGQAAQDDAAGEQLPSVPEPSGEENWQTVEDSYFEDAAFLGASRTEGLSLFAPVPGATVICHRGLMAGDVDSRRLFPEDNPSMTALEYLNRGTYGKVYLDFGVNELGYSARVFKTAYAALIEAVQASQPEAVIYICGIIPVTESQEQKSSYVNNSNVRIFNQVLQELAGEYGCCYLDLYQLYADEDGRLPEDISTDGVHLKYEEYARWRDYLYTHAVCSDGETEEVKGLSL